MAATDRRSGTAAGAATGAERRARRPGGADRLTVALLSVAAFLAVLALLGAEVRASATHGGAGHVVLVRRVYRTTVVETVVGGSGRGGGPAVTQSVSSSGSGMSVAAAPTTRTS